MTKVIKLIGIFTIIFAILGLGLMVFNDLSGPEGKTGLGSLFVFQIIIGAFLTYGAQLKLSGSLLAKKVYPSSIAAMVLFSAIAYRWFWYGV
jgi:hypothetical protein